MHNFDNLFHEKLIEQQLKVFVSKERTNSSSCLKKSLNYSSVILELRPKSRGVFMKLDKDLKKHTGESFKKRFVVYSYRYRNL